LRLCCKNGGRLLDDEAPQFGSSLKGSFISCAALKFDEGAPTSETRCMQGSLQQIFNSSSITVYKAGTMDDKTTNSVCQLSPLALQWSHIIPANLS
jgi:hypothetical protein